MPIVLTDTIRLFNLGISFIFTYSIQKDAKTGKYFCSCNQEDCSSPGKHPILKNWQCEKYDLNKLNLTEKEFVELLKENPDKSLAVKTGYNELLNGYLTVLDVDSKEHNEYINNLLKTENQFIVETSKGFHYYFISPKENKCSVKVIDENIDVRGTKGYVIAPDSLHISGRFYTLLTKEMEIPRIDIQLDNFGFIKKTTKKPKNKSKKSNNFDYCKKSYLPKDFQSWEEFSQALLNGNYKVKEGQRNNTMFGFAKYLYQTLKLNNSTELFVKCLEYFSGFQNKDLSNDFTKKEVKNICNQVSIYENKKQKKTLKEGFYQLDANKAYVDWLKSKCPHFFIPGRNYEEMLYEHLNSREKIFVEKLKKYLCSENWTKKVPRLRYQEKYLNLKEIKDLKKAFMKKAFIRFHPEYANNYFSQFLVKNGFKRLRNLHGVVYNLSRKKLANLDWNEFFKVDPRDLKYPEMINFTKRTIVKSHFNDTFKPSSTSLWYKDMNNQFSNLPQELSVDDKKEFVFVMDFFPEEIAGGAELTSQALLEGNKQNTQRIHSSSLQEWLIEENLNKHFILCNYSMVSGNALETLIASGVRYSVIEYDFKYCVFRSPYRHFMERNVPCDCANTYHGKLVQELYENAQNVFWMAKKQEEHYKQVFPDLNLKNSVVQSSTFNNETLNYINSVVSQKNTEYPNEYAILGEGSWIKGIQETEQWCKLNNKPYRKLPKMPYDQFLKELSKYKGLIFLPLDSDTCPRLVIEARLLGLEVITNGNSLHGQESWFATDDIPSIFDYLTKRQENFWKHFSD